MEVHGIRATDSNRERLIDHAPQGQLDCWQPPGDRERRAGQEWEFQPSRNVHHFLGLGEAVREVLVIEDRHGTAVLFEDPRHLSEEFIAWIQDLALFIAGVIAMFSDHENAVDGQLLTTAPQRLGDRRIDLEAKAASSFDALITVRLLIDVERHHIHGRPVPSPAQGIAGQESVAHMLGMRQVAPDGRDDRQLLPRPIDL